MQGSGKFVATERIHAGDGCKGTADDIRILSGKISAMEEVGEKAWKFTVIMDMDEESLLSWGPS